MSNLRVIFLEINASCAYFDLNHSTYIDYKEIIIMTVRPSHRQNDEMRSVSFEMGFSKHAEGSCLVKFGDTHVLCTASLEDKVPGWMKGSGCGWVTAEYGMLPRSTGQRMDREAARGKQSGRTQEIQRLIGRALRAVIDMEKMGEVQIRIDCDVIQADGGTRTASITGAYLALKQAVEFGMKRGIILQDPMIDQVAAISCGVYESTPVLDLDYTEDSEAGTDANFVLTASGGIVEIQGTAEDKPFSEDEFMLLLGLAKKGTTELFDLQNKVLATKALAA